MSIHVGVVFRLLESAYLRQRQVHRRPWSLVTSTFRFSE